ncbi:hypothetical protein RJ55_02010 [Drechmeria coniospora]|nr:hypothetical protein RJ55_02010 [Drechmeria coniospora]
MPSNGLRRRSGVLEATLQSVAVDFGRRFSVALSSGWRNHRRRFPQFGGRPGKTRGTRKRAESTGTPWDNRLGGGQKPEKNEDKVGRVSKRRKLQHKYCTCTMLELVCRTLALWDPSLWLSSACKPLAPAGDDGGQGAALGRDVRAQTEPQLGGRTRAAHTSSDPVAPLEPSLPNEAAQLIGQLAVEEGRGLILNRRIQWWASK